VENPRTPDSVVTRSHRSHNLSDEQVQTETERALQNQGGNEDDPDTEAGFVKLDKATYDRLNKGAQTAIDIEAREIDKRRKDTVEAAILAGKIPPARRAHYTKLMAADEKGTSDLLASLSPAAVPLGTPLGSGGGGEDGETADSAQGLPDAWFPDIAAKRADVAAGRVPTVTLAKEG
jgi:hypothetical protein